MGADTPARFVAKHAALLTWIDRHFISINSGQFPLPLTSKDASAWKHYSCTTDFGWRPHRHLTTRSMGGRPMT